MSEPKTLLAMAGADPTPNALGDATLVVINCQMEYVDGALPLAGVEAVLDEVARLLACACANHSYRPQGPRRFAVRSRGPDRAAGRTR